MSATPSVRIDKSFGFKGGTRIWSNRYHFNGGTPPDATHWHTLTDAIVTAEKAIHGAQTTIVGATCYAAGSDVPVASKVYSTVGTVTHAGGAVGCSGEVAALLRWSTSARTTKNHPIYLFSYIHGVAVNGGVSTDLLDANIKTAMNTYGGSWISGFSDGGSVTAVRASPNGAAATGQTVEEYVTHRDFPYTRSL